MYTAALSTNVAKSHWLLPARWMYYHLLDADWGSNALSWQWVAGSFSNKKYIANQENINRYCHSQQKNTFLDISYEILAEMPVPEILSDYQSLNLTTKIPEHKPVKINHELPVCVYNFYNLDPQWMADVEANRILLIEPKFFEKYPVNERVFKFFMDLSKNIPNIQIFVGSFNRLYELISTCDIHFKEHPSAEHYKGILTQRDWLFQGIDGYYPSFFAFWKQIEKQGFLKNY
jgi:deoxyribodipyrimidine photo-lyase